MCGAVGPFSFGYILIYPVHWTHKESKHKETHTHTHTHTRWYTKVEKATEVWDANAKVQQKVVGMGKGPVAAAAAPARKSNKVHGTVIPAPRKSVKSMIFESLVNFIARLFSCESANPPD